MDKLNIKCDFSTSAISDIQDINSSFAKGRLKVMYLGANRNKTYFSREAVRRALPSLRNVPVVCNWNYEDGIIGGHDMDVIQDSKGSVRLMNLTDPCGVVPDHAKFSFVTEVSEGGVEHEYLVIDDVILWKRQDVFNHIKNDLDGKVDHSMEVNIFEKAVNAEGQVDIRNFEFTALCLLERDEPCFQGSELELYSANNNAERFRAKFEEMLNELEQTTPVNTSTEDNNNNFSVEGGDTDLEEKIQLLAKYNLKAEDLDFAIEDVTVEELEEKLKVYTVEESEPEATQVEEAEPEVTEPEVVEPVSEIAETETAELESTSDVAVETESAEVAAEPETVDGAPVTEEATYALEQGFKEELYRAVESEVVTCEWGSVPRYCFVDYDKELGEVYAWDSEDWLLYGFKFTANGDAPVVDFESKSRKKFAIVDFEGGEQVSPFAEVYSQMNEKIKAISETEAKFETMETELTELRKFKSDIELANANEAKKNIFAQFEDLQGNAAFEALIEDCEKYDLETLEEKCYAIRGRAGSMKFSFEQKAPKTIVDKTIEPDNFEPDPYGGVVEKFN